MQNLKSKIHKGDPCIIFQIAAKQRIFFLKKAVFVAYIKTVIILQIDMDKAIAAMNMTIAMATKRGKKVKVQ